MKKGDVLFYTSIISGYIFMVVIMLVVQYTTMLEETGDPDLALQSNKIKTGLGAGAGFYFGFLIIYWFSSFLKAFKEANSLERQNIKLKDTISVKEFEGIGILDKDQVKVSSITVDEIFLNRELQQMFEEIDARLSRFYEKNVVQTAINKNDKKNNEQDTSRIQFEIVNLKKHDIDFDSYQLEYLLFKELSSFFNDEELEFLEDHGITNADQYLALDIEDIHGLESDYVWRFTANRDFKSVQIRLDNTLDILSMEEVSWFRDKGIKSVNDMMTTDLETLTVEFNAHFFPGGKPKKKIPFIDKVLKKAKEATKPVDLRDVVDHIVEMIIEKESKFLYSLSSDARFKYVYLKLVNMKSLNYKYFAYLVEFDQPIEIEVGEPDYRIFKDSKEIEGIVTMERYVEINKSLIILPASWEESFEYGPGALYSYKGHTVRCSKLTDVEYVFKGMLDHEHAILFTISCSYIREYLRTQLELDTATVRDREREALIYYVQHVISPFQ